MTASLVLHQGAREVTPEYLDTLVCPEGTDTWKPVSHGEVVRQTSTLLGDAGFQIKKLRTAVSSNQAQVFATFDLEAPLAEGVSLAVGLRSSTDQSLSLGFTAGSRVFVCDNLAFSAELIIKKRHTIYGLTRFGEAISKSLPKLKQFQEAESHRINGWRELELKPDQAEATLLRCFKNGVLKSPTLLRDAIQEWEKPSFEEFQPRTAWSLYNAVTTILGPRAQKNPQAHSALTLQLGGIFQNLLPSPATVVEIPRGVVDLDAGEVPVLEQAV